MIRIEGLTAGYGATVALRDVSIELTPGAWGLFGPNASGKSTLLRAVAGLLQPFSGRIQRWGYPSGRMPEAARRRIGWAGHQAGLYPKLSVRENLDLFCRLCDGDVSTIPGLVARLGLEEKRSVAVGDLSAGFQRRAAIARALVHDPDLLLLDEPFANLDEEASQQVTAAIIEWHQKDPGRTSVVATHGAKRVRAFATSGLVLRAGRLASVQDYRT